MLLELFPKVVDFLLKPEPHFLAEERVGGDLHSTAY